MARSVFISIFFATCVHSRPSEQERVALWQKKNTWPPTWQPENPGMKALMEFREAEIMNLTASNERWENWLQFTQSRLVPKFTSQGFDIVKTPPAIHAKLAAAVGRGVANFNSLRSEGDVDVIYNPPGMDPKFVDLNHMAWEVIEELRTMHEDWAGGIKLRPTSAYGVRLYQNESSLVMHYDRVQTHVISSIVHIAHEYDNDEEPWPIEIEDHDGNLHAVNLEPGQMLFYESAKNLHGRMKLFKGKYYGSIFLHYQPEDKAIWDYDIEHVIASVPPHWREGITEEFGSRFAGACLTIDSRVTASAPPRTRLDEPNDIFAQALEERDAETDYGYTDAEEGDDSGSHDEL